jgi:hypothetical protein
MNRQSRKRPVSSKFTKNYTEIADKTSRAENLPHPAYSRDLAPSDFFLFGHIKEKLSDYNCEGREDILNAITEIFTGADQEVLLSVFESWANRVKWVTKHQRKYCTEQRESKRSFFKTGRENRGIRSYGPPL